MRRAVSAVVVSAMIVGVAWVTTAAAASPISFGLELGLVSRDIEEEGPLVVGTERGTADSTRLAARLGLTVAPMLILFGEVGAADISIDEFQDYRSDLHLLYGGGARVILVDGSYRGGVAVYSDFKVTRLKTDDQICAADCETAAPIFGDEEIAWTEYAMSLGIRGHYDMLRPFGGIRVSKLDGTDRLTLQTGVQLEADVREQDSVGFFLGTDIMLDRAGRTAITLQLSGIDENALRVGYKVMF